MTKPLCLGTATEAAFISNMSTGISQQVREKGRDKDQSVCLSSVCFAKRRELVLKSVSSMPGHQNLCWVVSLRFPTASSDLVLGTHKDHGKAKHQIPHAKLWFNPGDTQGPLQSKTPQANLLKNKLERQESWVSDCLCFRLCMLLTLHDFLSPYPGCLHFILMSDNFL